MPATYRLLGVHQTQRNPWWLGHRFKSYQEYMCGSREWNQAGSKPQVTQGLGGQRQIAVRSREISGSPKGKFRGSQARSQQSGERGTSDRTAAWTTDVCTRTERPGSSRRKARSTSVTPTRKLQRTRPTRREANVRPPRQGENSRETAGRGGACGEGTARGVGDSCPRTRVHGASCSVPAAWGDDREVLGISGFG